MLKFLPIVLPVLGLGAGVGAGIFVPPPAPLPADCPAPESEAALDASTPPDTPVEYMKLNNQFVVPLVDGNDVTSMVIVSLSLEIAQGRQEDIYNIEPKLRDAFLRVLFDHASLGGFEGNFLSHLGLDTLRLALREMGQSTAGPVLRDVLIVDLVKQAI
ncbi:flagellar basal body-associated FliL family protein [Meridianimarinicoccus sp. RP-17]|uniref:flagellar basal body-associated FliL family protein n=1 Tax=Meridianimarinicoccus zhengii TaxID=2056810 RepID=UPI000DAED871|nr:flagellar basal body-associated FliL family protein [Phycocomes zhengii]